MFQIVILADVPLNYLFSNEQPSDLYVTDEHRSLMDDLSLNKDSVRINLNLNNVDMKN